MRRQPTSRRRRSAWRALRRRKPLSQASNARCDAVDLGRKNLNRQRHIADIAKSQSAPNIRREDLSFPPPSRRLRPESDAGQTAPPPPPPARRALLFGAESRTPAERLPNARQE